MASGVDALIEFHKGQSLGVIVEYFTPNLIAVSFTGGGKMFRGVLLAENERAGVNEHRTASGNSWPLCLSSPEGIVCGSSSSTINGSTTGLCVKTSPCVVERYTYKTDGQPSLLTVYRCTPKLPATSCASLLPHSAHHHPHLPQHPRVVIRAPQGLARGSLSDFLCRNCKKSLSPNNSAPPRPSSKRNHLADRIQPPTPASTATTIKKRRSAAPSEELAEVVPEKTRRRISATTPDESAVIAKQNTKTTVPKGDALAFRVKKAAQESPRASPVHRPPKDKIRAQSTALLQSARALSSPRRTDAERNGNSSSDTPFAVFPVTRRPQRLPYEKPKNRWMHAELRKIQEKKPSLNGLVSPFPTSTQTRIPSPLPPSQLPVEPVSQTQSKPEAAPAAVTPPLPPIKIKINRGVVVGPGESSESEQGKSFEITDEYQLMPMEALTDTPEPLPPSNSPTNFPIPPQSGSMESHSATLLLAASSPITSTSPVGSTREDSGRVGERFVKWYRLPSSSSSSLSSSSTVFRLGDVVWCKLVGWPWWPARITGLRCAQGDTICDACVRWFAWDQVSYFPCDKIWPFLTHHDRKVDKKRAKKRGAYKQAVDEAFAAAQQREAALRAAGIVNDEDDGDDGSGWVAVTSSKWCTSPPPPSSSVPSLAKKPRVKRVYTKQNQRESAPPDTAGVALPPPPPAVNGLPAPSDESGSEFDGSGPLIIDPHSTPNVPQTPDGDGSESCAFGPAHPQPTTSSCPIMQQQ